MSVDALTNPDHKLLATNPDYPLPTYLFTTCTANGPILERQKGPLYTPRRQTPPP